MVEALAGEAPRRVRLEHDDRRDRILAAAQALFAHRAYESISTTEVAEAAGTTRTNLNYYFGTKRNLYLEVVRRFAELKLPYVPRDGRPRQEAVAEVFAQWLDLVEDNAETFLILARAQTAPLDVEIASVLQRSLLAWENRLLRLLDLSDSDIRARASIRSFQAMIGVACDQWLRDATLTKQDVHSLLSQTLLAIGDQLGPPTYSAR